MIIQTYREILAPVFGADALQAAELQVYTFSHYAGWSGEHKYARYACPDGTCAAGKMVAASPLSERQDYKDYEFSEGKNFPAAGELSDALGLDNDVEAILDEITGSNDAGKFATPGSLTAYLDTPYMPFHDED